LSFNLMFTFHLGPLSRRARMFLQLAAGCLGACVLIGPSFLALSRSPPIAAIPSWASLRMLPVKPFADLGAGGCLADDLPVHAGPAVVQGTLAGRSALQDRLNGAVFACARDGWKGDVTISATVDARGAITGVLSQGNASPVMRSCLTVHILEGEPLASRGPGTLKVGYFMGERPGRR
jgi:hypothetical protein